MPTLNWKYPLAFFGTLLLMSILFHYPVTLETPPYGIHQWRQGDALSIVQNYYHEDRGLFDPRMNYMGHGEEDGLGEFPLLYYLNAQLMKLFGNGMVVPKTVNILIVFAGLYFLFLALRRVLKSTFWGAFFPLLLFCSPLVVYYTNTTMLNMPALGFLFIAYYYLVRFHENGNGHVLAKGVLFLTLAGLCRVTMFMGAVPFYTILLFELLFGHRYGPAGKPFFPNPLRNGALLSIPILCIGGWYGYAKYFNNVEGNEYFLMETRPMFALPVEGIWAIAVRLYHEHLQLLLTQPLFLFLALLFVLITFFPSRFHRTLRLFTWSTGAVTLLYFLLWYNHLYQHDYYLLDTLPFSLSIAVTFFFGLKHKFPSVAPSKVLRAAAVLLLVTGVYNGFVLQGKRFDISGTLMKNNFLLSPKRAEFWDYLHDREQDKRALRDITPYLRSLGIERSDPVISVPDRTPNHTLSLMDQKGFTQLYNEGKKGRELIEMWMEQGAEYLIVNDPDYLKKYELNPYTKDLIGSYDQVRIYRLPERVKKDQANT